ncbi:anti-sigma factor [Cellulomonas sp. HZM]|uniref:anti-sigma factor n=1 Tax=Cellulomonas sp. HZM TaxID=1454010 RepID=UPI000690D533|nr:anti-sigma factor [Cellulomonas sp. HZM]
MSDELPGTGSGPEDVRALLGAYALDAVDADERLAVERLVAADADAARELAQLRDVAARLGTAVRADPPATLRASVLAAVAAERARAGGAGSSSAAAPVPTPELVPTPRHRASARWWSLAAAVVVGAAVPTTLLVQQHQHADQVAAQQQAIADILRDPTAVLVHGEVAGGGNATAVLTADDALFSATGLPALSEGKVYQLWVVRDGQASSAGVMDDDAGAVRSLAQGYVAGDALAVTVEPRGGSEQPTSDPVVVLKA